MLMTRAAVPTSCIRVGKHATSVPSLRSNPPGAAHRPSYRAAIRCVVMGTLFRRAFTGKLTSSENSSRMKLFLCLPICGKLLQHGHGQQHAACQDQASGTAGVESRSTAQDQGGRRE